KRTRKLPGVYPNRRAASAEGRCSTKYARRASYWRCVVLDGSRKNRAKSVSSDSSLLDIQPLYYLHIRNTSTICCIEQEFGIFHIISRCEPNRSPLRPDYRSQAVSR